MTTAIIQDDSPLFFHTEANIVVSNIIIRCVISYPLRSLFFFFIIVLDQVIGLKFKDHSSLHKDSKTEKYPIKKKNKASLPLLHIPCGVSKFLFPSHLPPTPTFHITLL